MKLIYFKVDKKEDAEKMPTAAGVQKEGESDPGDPRPDAPPRAPPGTQRPTPSPRPMAQAPLTLLEGPSFPCVCFCLHTRARL